MLRTFLPLPNILPRTVCLAQRESEPTQTLLCARGGQPDSAILHRVREVTARTMWISSACAVAIVPRTTRIDPRWTCGLK
ncbi:uncharacterized [Tachysurus ichikawai]